MQQKAILRYSLFLSIFFLLIFVLLGPDELVGIAHAAKVARRGMLNLTQYVNPFIGTSAEAPFGSGDTFPGAAYPMGMVQWSPDTLSNPAGGYAYHDSQIKDLSLTHYSGRGCQSYQDFPFMPYVGAITFSPATHGSLYYSHFSHSGESAYPGYYKVHLDNPNVMAELSVTPHTGMGQFTYPASSASSMLINAGGSRNGNTKSSVTIFPGGQEVTGSATSTVGCGSQHYTLYFVAQFDAPFTSYGTWNGDSVSQGSSSSSGQHTGAFVTFDTTSEQVVHAQVGLSFVSIANAQLNLEAESANFNFAAVVARTGSAWNNILNAIQVKGGTADEVVTFYTALYHTFFHPNIFSDVNGQYIGFDNQIHTVPDGHYQYENISGWDDYRTLIRLQAILAPSVVSDIAQSLVNDAQQGDGHLPRWEQANTDSRGMSGDDGDVMIAEAYAFGATNFDTLGALTAMINGQSHIREGLKDYLNLGYVAAPTNFYSASITQEYTNDDFAIAQFAGALGDTKDYATFLLRSGNWLHLFNPASGYIQPRNADGSWDANFSPTRLKGFQEGDSAQYSWMESFNLRGLFDLMGSNAVVVNRLDTFFTKLNGGQKSPYAFMGNEPSFEVPWEYDFAQAPSHTQEVVRRIQTQLFKDTTGGLPGNDDGGEMSSWYIFSAIGLYPEITAIGGLVIGSPLFTSVTLHLANGSSLQINASAASDTTPYVQSLNLNGNPTTSLWLPWNFVQDGATLDFTLGSSASSWGSGVDDAPPSYPPTGLLQNVG